MKIFGPFLWHTPRAHWSTRPEYQLLEVRLTHGFPIETQLNLRGRLPVTGTSLSFRTVCGGIAWWWPGQEAGREVWTVLRNMVCPSEPVKTIASALSPRPSHLCNVHARTYTWSRMESAGKLFSIEDWETGVALVTSSSHATLSNHNGTRDCLRNQKKVPFFHCRLMDIGHPNNALDWMLQPPYCVWTISQCIWRNISDHQVSSTHSRPGSVPTALN